MPLEEADCRDSRTAEIVGKLGERQFSGQLIIVERMTNMRTLLYSGILALVCGLANNVFAWSDWSGTITKVETHRQYSPVYNPAENVVIVRTSDGRMSWFSLSESDFSKALLAIVLSAKANYETVTLKVAENQPLVAGGQIYRIHACY